MSDDRLGLVNRITLYQLYQSFRAQGFPYETGH